MCPIYQNEAHEILGHTDYLYYVTKSSTQEQRAKFDIGDLFINAAVCKWCGSYIRSENRHDMKWCYCGKVAVDGGSWYAKRVGDPRDYIDVIERFYDSDNKKLEKKVK